MDKQNLTPFGPAMKRLGIERIAACSPEAHGRSERMFRAHPDRLPRELALAGITDMAGANRYLADVYRPAFNAEFMQSAMEEGSLFVGWIGGALDDILGERFERTVGNDNGVSFERMKWQIRRSSSLPRRQGQSDRIASYRSHAGDPAWPAQVSRL
ncbi:MAG TPA: hypothetical protein PK981_10655 [Accumulibacter sp.]|nr:hypothetical protein [Accumulibacter sp.]